MRSLSLFEVAAYLAVSIHTQLHLPLDLPQSGAGIDGRGAVFIRYGEHGGLVVSHSSPA